MSVEVSALSSCWIVGAGPGGLAPLFAAAHAGSLGDPLDAGVTILEQKAEVGSGELGRYAIRSDSAAEAFLNVVMRTTEPSLAALQSHPIVTLQLPSEGRSTAAVETTFPSRKSGILWRR